MFEANLQRIFNYCIKSASECGVLKSPPFLSSNSSGYQSDCEIQWHSVGLHGISDCSQFSAGLYVSYQANTQTQFFCL